MNNICIYVYANKSLKQNFIVNGEVWESKMVSTYVKYIRHKYTKIYI